MGLENNILLVTGSAGKEEVFSLDKTRKITSTAEKAKINYLLLGVASIGDLAAIVIPYNIAKAKLVNFTDYKGKDNNLIIPALRFFREDANCPFECFDLSSKLIIGQRLVIADSAGMVKDYVDVKPNNSSGVVHLTFKESIENYLTKDSLRFSRERQKTGFEIFKVDDNGNYELKSRLRINGENFFLSNLQNNNEIYVPQLVSFTRISLPLLRVDVVDSTGKVHPELTEGSQNITHFYTKHTMIVRRLVNKEQS